MFCEEHYAVRDLHNFFEIDLPEHCDALNKEVLYIGTDIAYHHFAIRDSPITFCILKPEFFVLSDSFKLISFFLSEADSIEEQFDRFINIDAALEYLPTNLSELFTIQLGKIFRENFAV